MQIRDRLTVRIEKIAFGGEGVARIDNFVVFVPFAAPEDELEIEVVQCKKKFARGRILKIIKASPLRIKPSCVYYECCGGCCYQHINYEQQLEIKRQQVAEAFVRIGKIPVPPVTLALASPSVYHYRGKAQFHQVMCNGTPRLGFLDISGGKVVDIAHCEIMEETINKKLKFLREKMATSNNHGVRLNVWSNLPGDHLDKKNQIKRVVKGKEFFVSDNGFFQNNLFLTETLVDEVSRMALSGPLDTIIDVYCGCGLFSIFLAPFAKKVFGIELNRKAVEFAQFNAEKENIRNINFVCGDAGDELSKEEYCSLPGAVDLLILDPPRVGCSESTFKAIVRLRPQRLIYVSCNPTTQARDIKLFNESGYNLLTLQPLDMFPQTQHVEVIALLEYK